jgi:uncharacterized protein
MTGKLRVEVVYARAEFQDRVSLDLAEGAVAREAVEASGLIDRYGLPARPVLGIAGRRAAAEQRLRDGDRVEILRNLAADPKEARRQRVRSVRRRRARV